MIRFFLVFFLVLLSPNTAKARVCDTFENLKNAFESRFGEVPTSTGISTVNRIVIISSDTGSFTIIKVFPNGNACVIEYGRDWETFVIKKGKET